MKITTRLVPVLATLAVLLAPPVAHAQVAGAPATIDFQSQVLDTTGNPIAPNGPENFRMQFRIYESQTGGTIIWSESQIVTVSNGQFSVRLGSGVPIPGAGGNPEGPVTDLREAFNGTNRYLGLTVEIPGQAPAEITPRMAFLSAPFSMVAERAKLADAATSANVAGSVVQTAGTSRLGETTVSSLVVSGTGSIGGGNIMEFGSGQADSTGKIRYQHGLGWLNIEGASNAPGEARKVRIQAEGGLQVNGPLTVLGGKITGDGSGLTGVTADIAPGSIDLAMLVKAVQDALCPVGTIVAFSGDTAPPGWLLCDGRAFTGTGTYKALYDVIGTRFGNGDGSAARFRIPDLRGRFLRGVDGTANRDPDKAARTSFDEGSSGNNVGSLQGDSLRAHAHTYEDIFFAEAGVGNNVLGTGVTRAALPKAPGFPGGPGNFGGWDVDNEGIQWSRNSEAFGGSETRPTNIYVNFIIKY